jgi:hypothetical protein
MMYGEPEAHATNRQAAAKAPTSIATARPRKAEAPLRGRNSDGCMYIVERIRSWTGKRYVLSPCFCHKLTADGSQFCPKHQLMTEWAAETQPQPH